MYKEEPFIIIITECNEAWELDSREYFWGEGRSLKLSLTCLPKWRQAWPTWTPGVIELHPPRPGNTEHSSCPTVKNVELPDFAFDIKFHISHMGWYKEQHFMKIYFALTYTPPCT